VGVISVLLVKLVFILKTEFAKLVSDNVLNVKVLLFAQNAIQVYLTWIPTTNVSACLVTILTPLQIFVLNNVVIFTIRAVTSVIILNAWHVIQVIIYKMESATNVKIPV
jgi:hypothetical protein